MAFRNKLAALSALAGVLLASYVLTFALSPETRASRASRWSALGAKAALEADAVALSGAEDLSLVKTNGVWFVDAAGNQFPARASRVEDLFSALTREGFYPVRSRSAASYEKFGVGDNRRGAIVVKSGGVILLELYLGNEGVSGNEAYLRSGAEEAVRSGADVFSSFTGSGGASWRDARLFPDHDAHKLTVDSVQRVRVAPADGREAYVMARRQGGWQFDGGGEALDAPAVEAAIRFILDCTADDFIADAPPPPQEPSAESGTIALETGDGATLTITIGAAIDGKRSARVSTSAYVYALADWTVSRLWRDKSDYLAK